MRYMYCVDSLSSPYAIYWFRFPGAEESDKFDDDFDESESDNDDDGTEETALRKKERAAKVRTLCGS